MSEIEQFRTECESAARRMRAKCFGVADLEKLARAFGQLTEPALAGYGRAVVFGMRLQRAALEGISDRPTAAYFHNYRQLNHELDRLGWLLADMIQDCGFRALAVAASQITTSNPPRGAVSHKLLAWGAGLGFMGRSNLVVHPEYGAQLRFASVLTDMPLRPDAVRPGSCGNCRACEAVCPAGAIKERVEDFDRSACFAKLAEFARIPFIGQHVCGVCVKACAGSAREVG